MRVRPGRVPETADRIACGGSEIQEYLTANALADAAKDFRKKRKIFL
jgi:hypothetical protein